MIQRITKKLAPLRPYAFPTLMIAILATGTLFKYPTHAASERSRERTPEQQHRRNTRKSFLGIGGGAIVGGSIVGAAAGPYGWAGAAGGALIGGLIAREVRKSKERRNATGNGLRATHREQAESHMMPASAG